MRTSTASTTCRVDRFVPHGDDVVHLLRGLMFFAAFFGAPVLCTLAVGGRGSAARVSRCSATSSCGRSSRPSGRPTAPGHVGGPPPDSTFGTIPAIGVPALNTAILLTSGLTVTFAHLAAAAPGRRRPSGAVPGADVPCWGSPSSACRPASTARPTGSWGLRLSTGIYGSTFFMLTGFHGLHVTFGRDHAHGHLACGCCAATSPPTGTSHSRRSAWYWHFVDWVWLAPVHLRLLAVVSAHLAGRHREADGRRLPTMRRDVAGLQGVGRYQPQVPGQHQQRKTARATR